MSAISARAESPRSRSRGSPTSRRAELADATHVAQEQLRRQAVDRCADVLEQARAADRQRDAAAAVLTRLDDVVHLQRADLPRPGVALVDPRDLDRDRGE